MKIKSLIIKDDDLEKSFKTAIIATLIGYGRMYELLHKQLWRKGRVTTIAHDITINGRTARPIKYWNIKSPSRNPYNRDNQDDLGLNQLFVGQSPNSAYKGDPGSGSGIYHDTSQIIPTPQDLTGALDNTGWFIQGNLSLMQYNQWAEPQYDNVSQPYEKTHIVHHDAVEDDPDTTDVDESKPAYDETVSDGWFVLVTPHGSAAYEQGLSDTSGTDINGDPVTIPASSLTTEYIDYTAAYGMEKVVAIPDLTGEHGAIVYQEDTAPIIRPKNVEVNRSYIFGMKNAVLSRVIVYGDGTCIQFATPTVYTEGFGGGDGDDGNATKYFTNGTKTYLPLVYMDTGDLVQNRIDFIDSWDTMFELNVVENSYWYSGLIQIVAIIVSVILAICGGLGLLGIIGALIGSVGSITGNKFLMVLGAVMTLGASIEVQGAQEIAKGALVQHMATLSAQTVLEHTSFIELFGAYVSDAGFGNLLNIGSSVYSMYNVVTAPGAPSVPSSSPVEDSGMKIARIDDEDNNDPVMRLIKLPLMI